MMWMASAFIFAAIVAGIRIKASWQNCQYRKKVRQLKQLKRIYLYLLNYQKNPEEAKQYLGKDIVLDGEWLYTDKFYFNLQDGLAWSRLKQYFMDFSIDYSHYYLWNNGRNTRMIGEDISSNFAKNY